MNAAVTVFVYLLDEGTDVWRPVSASSLGDGRFVIHGPVPDDEKWQFEPGTTVLCEARTFQNGSQGLVAMQELSA